LLGGCRISLMLNAGYESADRAFKQVADLGSRSQRIRDVGN